MDAVELIAADHDNIRNLFRRFNDLGPEAHDEKQQTADQIVHDLMAHAEAKQEILYPEVHRVAPDVARQAEDDLEGNLLAEGLVTEVGSMNTGDERFANVKMLEELITRHLEYEEQELLPRVRDAMSQEMLDDLGERMVAAKKAKRSGRNPGGQQRG